MLILLRYFLFDYSHFIIFRENIFKDCGEIVDIRLHTDREGKFKGHAHVQFATADAAQKVILAIVQVILELPKSNNAIYFSYILMIKFSSLILFQILFSFLEFLMEFIDLIWFLFQSQIHNNTLLR